MSPDDLRTFRGESGLTQAGLAARLNVASNTVARWERGELAIPPFLDLALDTVGVQLTEERSKRGPGRPPKRTRRAAPPSED